MTRPTDWVVDAGVAVKWYVPEIHEAEAKRWLDPALALHVPELFYPEFGSILWKKSRLLKVPEITVEEGRDILRLLLDVKITKQPNAPLLEAAYEIATGPGRSTVYDSTYLALALSLDCRLVTADRAFFESVQSGPHAAHIHWVADPF